MYIVHCSCSAVARRHDTLLFNEIQEQINFTAKLKKLKLTKVTQKNLTVWN